MYDWIPNEPLPEAIFKSIQAGVATIITRWRNTTPLPETLFHYTDAGGLKGIIEGGHLRATHVAFMNDTREYMHAVSLLLDAVRAMKRQSISPLIAKTLSELDDFIAPTSAENAPPIFVACFTAEDNSLNQWRAYGRGEGGYSLGFDPVQMQGTAGSAVLMPVLYDEAIQRLVVEQLLSWALSEYESLSNQVKQFAEEKHRKLWWTWLLLVATQIAPMMKNNAFQPEAEWRYVIWCNTVGEMDFVPKATGLVPYTKLYFGNKRDGQPNLLPVTKLYSGPGKASGAALQSGRKLLEKFGYFGVPLEASAIPFRVS